ncbi:hypothetical protein CVT25_014963 [Psilocybe cyanescens]|uniref:ABC transporter domain-containing protein n=1 Tax=Psilocybe cyanescens TaxID=93625 RepID=A0A409XI53_PSICY|nr:hypothetical protein CVT25_014963 [Psilocybe cyanescens]
MNLMAPPSSYTPSGSTSRPKLGSSASDPGPAAIALNHSESPLTNLVRRTSSRRARQTATALDHQHKQDLQTPPIRETREDPYFNESNAYNYNYTPRSSSPPHQEEIYAYAYQPEPASSASQYAYIQPESNSAVDNYYYEDQESPQRQMANLSLNPDTSGDSLLASNGLPSPLLHSHFARDSYATASISDAHSYWDPDSSGARSSTQSNYRQSSRRVTREGDGDFDDESSEYGRYQYFADDTSSMYSTNASQGPALRDSWNSTATGATVRRPDYYIPSADIRGKNQMVGSVVPTPTVVVTEEGIDGTERVVERSSSMLRPGPGRAPVVQPVTANFSRPVRESRHPRHAQGERVKVQLPPDMREQKLKVLERNARRAPSPNETQPTSMMSSRVNSRQSLKSVQSNVTVRDQKLAPVNSQPRTVEPPPLSPASLYSSHYSYYQYESAAPSPVGAEFAQSTTVSKTPRPSLKVAEPSSGPRTPQDYLQLGIQHHEANRLGESARCFERSANEDGGCGVGMLMYGLTLRHGWGCAKNEKLGFKWLLKAAESAVGDLESVRTGGRTIEVGAVQTELVLAIYEVGQCFFHGWGVVKDQKMAVSYYAVAARLGDGDAQADLAFCLANGKGCKKDKKEAARWYREAVAQGQSDVGLLLMTIRHSKYGVWDLYEDLNGLPTTPGHQSWGVILQSLPYVWRMITEVASIRECWLLLTVYLFLLLLSSIVPAIALSYSGQLLSVVDSAVQHRTIDTALLRNIVVGAFLSSAATRILRYGIHRIAKPLKTHIKIYYSVHVFHAFARLDVPTFDDPAVQRQLQQPFSNMSTEPLAFSVINVTLRSVSTAIQLVTQSFVLFRLLRDQTDGLLLAFLCSLLAFYQRPKLHLGHINNTVWAATTNDQDFIKAEGLKQTVNEATHRKEIVAAGIAPYLLSEYRQAIYRISTRATDFYDAVMDTSNSYMFVVTNILIPEVLRALPEASIVFALRAIQQPESIPLSLASLNLITQTTSSFTRTAFSLMDDTTSITTTFSRVIHLYEVARIPNRVKVIPTEKTKEQQLPDHDDPMLGTPFPEDDQALRWGISVEFCQVSFKYPGSDMYALRKTSFKIERGHLCVIVGTNGSGKSTILKLIARLYDPSEGKILIDGIDIKTLRLADLRRAISVLFQDYTLFPLSIRDNINLGDPQHASDLSKIQKAAELGGANDFIDRLPEKYDTYLERPVQDYYSDLPEGMENPFGHLVDYSRVREAGHIIGVEGGGSAGNRGLSGGQMQRIALTFMRSVASEDSVGLLLFDEPSASLDPTAEHDLFERLRKLRGNKTMIFSSHRFGNLTRHADLILYMNDSVVLEEGTHDQLIHQDGEYARIWMLQAQAFL